MTQKLLGFLLAWIVRVLSWSWRVRVIAPDTLFSAREPLVFAFWHGQQLALLAAPRRRSALVMVSHSKDGAIQSRVMSRLGFCVVRGSTSRGAARATKTIVQELRSRELDAVFAADGPRGPHRKAKPGAAKVASLAKALLVPLGCASSHSFVLRRAWDRFEIPLPFARVVIVVHPSIDPLHPTLLSAAIDAASAEARKEISQEGGKAGRILGVGEECGSRSEPRNPPSDLPPLRVSRSASALPFSSREIPDPNSPAISPENPA